jgi:hypothetical protein
MRKNNKVKTSYLFSNKKGQVGVIVIILIVLISIVAVAIVWNIVNPLVREKSEDIEIESFTISLEVAKVILFENGVIHVTVKGGGDELEELRFIFYDKNGNAKVLDENGLNEFETKTYYFSAIKNFGEVKSVSVVPIVNNKFGIESEVKTGEVFEVPSGVVVWKKSNEGNFEEVHSDYDLIFGNQIAISFWVNESGTIIGEDYNISYANNKTNLSYNNEKFQFENSDSLIRNHMVISIDSTAHSKIYFNNNLIDTFNVDSDLSIGDKNITLFGELEDVIVFNKALSDSEVEGIYNHQFR